LGDHFKAECTEEQSAPNKGVAENKAHQKGFAKDFVERR
jgi:hypothetical protein